MQFCMKDNPNVVYGKLGNGFQYAIYNSDTITNQEICIRLVVNAGSIMETDEQSGAAHFLEHIAFRGSKNFPGGNMIEEMQKIGIDFGTGLNASTSYLHTIFKIKIPDTNSEKISKCLIVANDFANGLTISQKEVDSERGVILAELRDGDNYKSRLTKKFIQFIYGETIMPKRFPIGKKEIIEKITAEDLKNFYTTWYTPNRMFLAVVGKIKNTEAVETDIKNLFSDMKNHDPDVADVLLGNFDRHGIFYQFNVENDLPSVTGHITCINGNDHHREDTIEQRKNDILRAIATSIINLRLDKLEKKKNFLLSESEFSFNFNRALGCEQSSIEFTCRQDNWKECLTIIWQEIKKVLEFGFTDKEFDLEVNAYRKVIREQLRKAENRKSIEIIRDMCNAYITHRHFLAIKDECEMNSLIIDEITKADCENMVKFIWNNDNLYLSINSNKAEEDPENAIKETFEKARDLPVEQDISMDVHELPAIDFEPGKVISRKDIKDLDFCQIRFFNNVRLNVKTIHKPINQVDVSVRFGNGLLAVDKSRIGSNILAESTFINGGLLTHSITNINEILSDKYVSMSSLVLESDSFKLHGQSSSDLDDFNLLITLLYHYIKQPGFRNEAIQEFRENMARFYVALEKTPNMKLMDVTYKLITNNDFRFCLPSFDRINQLTLEDAKGLMQESLSHGPMEITIVGNVSIKDAIGQVAKTFGTLPARKATKPAYKNERKLNINHSSGLFQHYFDGDDERELLSVFWITCGLNNRTISDHRILSVIGSIIGDRLRVKVRKELGEAYSPCVVSYNNDTFENLGLLKIDVSIDQTKFEMVRHMVDKEINDLYKNGATEDEFIRALEPIIQNTKNDLDDESYWLIALSGSQEKPEKLDYIRYRHDFFKSLSLNSVNVVIKKYLKPEAMTYIRMCQKTKNTQNADATR
ncbi:MAG: insulinase family protein [Puniceicoccales bacterium]|nr:insulinase family protein [Puniceicoccales bacterium]